MARNLAEIIPAFFNGPNGEQLTPEQIRDRQLIAQSLMAQATDTSPNAGGWASILAKGVQGFQAGRERRGADDAISGNNAYNSDLLSSLLSGSSSSPTSSPTLAASAATSGAAQEMASTSPAVDSSGILPASFLAAVDRTEGAGGYDTLYGHAQKNGPFAGTSISSMPIKDALAFADPSGAYGQSVKGQIGRVATPMGRYQIVGTTLKNAVGALGLDPNAPFDQRAQDSVAAYLAKQRIASADTLPGKISALRSEWHGFKSVPDNQMAQIVADLERGGTQMASASQAAAAIENIAPQNSYIDPLVSAQAYVAPQTVAPISASPAAQPLTALSAESGFDAGRFGEAPAAPVSASPMAGAAPEIYSAQTDFAPELPAPVNVAPAPAVAAVQQPAAQTAQLPQAPSANTAIIAQALRVMGDPRANDGTRRVAQALLQQEQQKQQFAQEQNVWQQRQEYERQQQNNDPLRQLQIQKAQIEINSANQPQRQPLLNAGNGALYDPNEKSWIQAPNTGQDKLPDSVRALQERANLAGLKPGTPEYNQFIISGGSGGTQLSVGPNGEVSFSQGGASRPLTEGQSKDAFFTTRMTAAAPTIDQFETALMSAGEAVAGAIPGGRYLQSEEYQLAKDAGDDFVAAFLRKDSGAALTKEERSEYGNLLLPQPTDKPALIDAKRQRRQIAVQAIKSGLPSNAVEGVIKAINAVPGADQPAQTTTEKSSRPESSQSDDISRAKAAIAKGANREAVIKRLRDAGISTEGL